ncbi:MAG: ATP-binding protein [Cellvibrio sp.]|uniref:ATP-binding protein n=1 Tax=Cellvibrio sp. TaxID=1965322 RepID=UPI0031A42452
MQRLTLSLLLVVVTAVLGLGWGIDRWYNAQFAEQEDPTVSAYKLLGRELAQLVDANEQAGIWSSDNWQSVSKLQPQLTAYIDFPLPEDVKHSFEAGESLLLESGDQLSLHFYLARQQRVLSLTLPEELHRETNNSLRWLLTLLFYGGVIIMVLIWLYPLLRRLALLRNTTQAFGAGDLQARIATDKHSYIHTIEQDFNRMAQRIEQLIADNKLLSRGLSHDLRTPLARLRFGLDVLEEANLNAEQQRNLAHLNRDLIAMESLVEALLNYARLEQAVIAFSPQPIQLAMFVTQLRDDFYRGQVELFIAPSVQHQIVQADPEYLSMLLHNLLQNALRYGGGAVQIGMQLADGHLHLQIEDDGPGIPPAERASVLQPFYRGDGGNQAISVSRGHGLGLAIVERIAQWHQLGLQLDESERLGGLRVTLIWPLSN